VVNTKFSISGIYLTFLFLNLRPVQDSFQFRTLK